MKYPGKRNGPFRGPREVTGAAIADPQKTFPRFVQFLFEEVVNPEGGMVRGSSGRVCER